jgi:hypothetical protein
MFNVFICVRSARFRLAALSLFALLMISAVPGARAATWTVDSTSADPALDACTAAPADCSFPGAVNRLAFVGDSIVFTVAESLASEVEIRKDGVIDAAGARLPKLVITTRGVGWATVILRNARWHGLDSGPIPGGALQIDRNQIVTIEDSEFLNNRSTAQGGAIFNRGTLLVARSRFEGNYSTGGAGAIHSTNFGSLTVLDSSFRANGVLDSAGPGRQLGQFGAISAESTLDIRGSLFHENESNYASAVRGAALSRIYNSTFVRNRTFQSSEGGALLLGGPTRIANCSIVANSGITSGGLFVYPASDTQVINTLIADNAGASPEISGRIYSLGNNLIRNRLGALVEGNVAATDIYDTDPRLSSLGSYGGPTLSLAALPESPLLNAGSSCVLSAGGCGDFPHVALSDDQRGGGFPRTRGGAVDIGAFELGSVLVSNAQDSGAGSLRQAIAEALPGDVVTFSPSYFNQTRTITLGSTLVVDKSMSIAGPGAALLTLDAGNQRRHLDVNAPATLNLRGLRFTRGNAGDNSGGGAILVNLGTLIASDILVDESTAQTGGCLYNNGTLNLARVRVSGCRAFHGAGVFNAPGGSADISDARIEDNVATGPAGGIGNPGSLVLTRVSLSGNQATIGGGLNSYGTATLTNVTFSGNTADNGGGMYLGGTSTTTLLHATVTANHAGYNGGVGAEASAIVNIFGTLMAGNTRSIDQAPDAGGNFTSQGYNLIGSTIGTVFRPDSPSLAGNLLNVPVRLAALADNHGYSLTHAPLFDSRTIDAAGPGLVLDGRGLARPVNFQNLADASGGNGSDIGAHELQVSTPLNVVAAPSASGVSVSFSGGANGGVPISSYRVTCGAQSATGPASPILVTGLAAGVAVTCTVTAHSGDLIGIPSAPSNSAAPAAPPQAPVIGVAVAGTGEVSVAFDPPASDGGSPILGYTATCGSRSQAGGASPIVVTGLPNGTAVACSVIATNAFGDSLPSAPSNSVTPATFPDPPVITGISAGDGSVTVSFVPPANNGGLPVTMYNAFCGGFAASSPTSPITVNGQTNGVPVTCRVNAANAAGGGLASPPSAAVTPGIAPAFVSSAPPAGTFGAPYLHNLSASGSPAPGFALANGELPTGLSLDPISGQLSGAPSEVGSFSGSFSASNGVGTAATQAFVIEIAAGLPDAPTDIVATAGNAAVSVAFVAPINTGGVALIGYSARCGDQEATAAASPITVAGLSNGVAVTCRVVARNSAGDSAPSAESAAVTPLQPDFAVSVTRAGAGSGRVLSTPQGIDCGNECSARFAAGSALGLSALALPGSRFSHWSGACSGTQTDCALTVNGKLSTTAHFTPVVSVMVQVSGGGRVTSAPGGIDCGINCEAGFDPATEVTLSAVADPGWSFDGWLVDCSGSAPMCLINTSQPRNVGALFVRPDAIFRSGFETPQP